jgi:hypothetical protein
MAQNSSKNKSTPLFLNTAIGFLGVLLLILVVSLITRIVFPRIENQRALEQSEFVTNIIQLEVLNGCGVPGMATRYTDKIREFGFDVVETGNFDHFNVENSFILSRSGSIENAYRVAQAIGVDQERVIIEESPDFYLDVTLVIGADYENLNF